MRNSSVYLYNHLGADLSIADLYTQVTKPAVSWKGLLVPKFGGMGFWKITGQENKGSNKKMVT